MRESFVHKLITSTLIVVSFKSLDWDLGNKPDRPWMLSIPTETVPLFVGDTDLLEPFTYNSFGHIDSAEQLLTF